MLSSLTHLLSVPRSDFFLSAEIDGVVDLQDNCVANAKQKKKDDEKRVHELVYALCEGDAGALVTSGSIWQSALFACRKFGSMPSHTRDQFVEAVSSNLSVLCAAITAR